MSANTALASTAKDAVKKTSDYGLQLRAKQKLKGYYGSITEKQFRSIYHMASQKRGDTGENLIGLLESRMDAIIYRAKFVPTVFAARQFINHGHVLLNGKKHTIGSARLKPGDVVEIREKSREIPMVIEAANSAEREVPVIFHEFEQHHLKCPSSPCGAR